MVIPLTNLAPILLVERLIFTYTKNLNNFSSLFFMRNIITTLALFLTSTGAFAQVTMPTKQLSVSDLTSDKTEQRIFLKSTSRTNDKWFTGELASADITGNTLFILQKKENGYVLKRLSTSNYIQPKEDRINFGAETNAQSFELINVPKANISDGDLIGQEPYVRFKKSDKEMFLNVQKLDWYPKFANGKGAWSVVNVYDATEYSLVTLNIHKDGNTESVKQAYKTGDNIVPPAYEGYTASYTKTTKTKDDAQVLEVTYYPAAASNVETTLALAKEVEKTEGKTGYPADATLYKTLRQKIQETETSKTEENSIALYNSITALYNATNVNLPVDGKTYVFTNHHKKTDGSIAQNYLKCTNDGLTLVGRASTTAEDYPLDAKFTCHKLENGQYLFVNNLGKYLVFKGNGQNTGANNNKGFVDTYDSIYCPMTIQKDAAGTGKDLFGLLSFGGQRKDVQGENSYFTITFGNSNYSFNQSHDFTFIYNNDHSTVFQIEEVAYANHPTLKAIKGDAIAINGAQRIATFSAPFATVLPEGISAYYIQQVDENNVARLTPLTGNVIPANTGVILTSTEAEKEVWMIPATETGTALSENLLGHSAGADKTFTNETCYILGSVNSNVGFYKGKANTTLGMNKAYLKSNATASAIKLQFDNNVTGIENATEQSHSAVAPIYDLSGRRVMHTVKGGFYIQNGKKFIVK